MFKSLSIRLLCVFVAGLIILIGLLRFGIEHSLANTINTLQAESLARMTLIILDRETDKVDFDRAHHVADSTGFRIHIHTPQKNWSSEDKAFDESDFQFEQLTLDTLRLRNKLYKNRKRRTPPSVAVAKGFNFNVYRVTTEHSVLFYKVDNQHVLFEWFWVLFAVLFILFLYLAIRYLFSPVADIRYVVKEVRKGNFSARTKTNRKDELGELAKQVNNMAEDLDRLIESKRSLLLSISHELRTPLTRAKISNNLLNENKHSQSLSDDLNEMEKIISELIEAEKLSQDSPLARQVTDINSLIEEVLHDSFNKDEIGFKPLVEKPYINVDPIRIKLLVKNLLKNAVKHSLNDQAAPSIIVNLNDCFLTIRVIDHGIGMSPEQLDRITEPFYRIDRSRQRETGGFGLGLYLCQAIIKAHHGELTIKSKEGHGTEITASIYLNDK